MGNRNWTWWEGVCSGSRRGLRAEYAQNTLYVYTKLSEINKRYYIRNKTLGNISIGRECKSRVTGPITGEIESVFLKVQSLRHTGSDLSISG